MNYHHLQPKPMKNSPIYLRLADIPSELPVGASHWWGYPDLPEDMPIPTVTDPTDGNTYALNFICQINLADLPEGIIRLPHSGLLLFFADIAYYNRQWNEPSISLHISGNEVVKIFYLPKEKLSQLVNRQDEYAEEELPAVPIQCTTERPPLSEPDHRLLGEPDYREWDDWDTPFEGWELLFQMDSCEGDGYNYNFIDCGVLNLIVAPEALNALDFSDVRATILST